MVRLTNVLVGMTSLSWAAGHSTVWPQPQVFTKGEAAVVLDPKDFTFHGAYEQKILKAAFKRYHKLFFPHTLTAPKVSFEGAFAGRGVSVEIVDPSADLAPGVDESYNLTVSTGGAGTISAATVWGAMHGLETLSQLIVYDFFAREYKLLGAPYVVQDYPRYPHRGLLVDVARHFEPIHQIKRIIDSMAYVKLNVLHWHLTEDQSFPMPSRVHPELPAKGAWSPTEQYSWEEVGEVVKYAHARGIRVMPEFDMPAHTSSWRNSHPEVFASGCPPGSGWTGRQAFDPAKNVTFELVESVLTDWSELFTDSYLHLGSDEVPTDCWNNTEDLAWMQTQGFTNFNQVFNYYINRAAGISKKLGKTTVFWDESFISGTPPKDAIIQVWHESSYVQAAVSAGYQVTLSTGWYLDHLDDSWQQMFVNDPRANISPDTQHLVLGGEACMWGETVDPSDMEMTVWPRLAVVAERLWSPALTGNTTVAVEEATPRLESFRCLLLSRGIRSAFVGGAGREPPTEPGSCTQGGSTFEIVTV